MTSVVGETRYTTTGHPNTNVITDTANPSYCAGCNGSFRLLFDETSIGTDRGVFAVGFDLFNRGNTGRPDDPFLYDALVEFGDGTSRSFDLPFNEAGLEFFGITSEARIRSIHFAPFGGDAPSTNGTFGIDDLTLGSSPVPEPATLSLLIAGILAVGCRARRQVTSDRHPN